MSIFKILEELSSTSSRTDKEEILLKHKDDELFRAVILAALDPYRNYYIKKIPKYTLSAPVELTYTLEHIVQERLTPLVERAVTGNAAIAYLTDILSRCESQEDATVVERIILGDLKCGIAAATINKVFGKNFVFEYPVMLCEKFSKKLADKLPWETGVRVDLKEDGMRVNVHVENGKVSLRARSGRSIEVFGVFDDQAIELATVNMADGKRTILDCVFDGELLVVDNDGELLPRKASNGICNKAIKGTISQEEASRLRISLWDVIPSASLLEGSCAAELRDREAVLGRQFDRLQATVHTPKFRLTPYQYVYSYEAAVAIFNGYLLEGREGVILKDPSAPWEDKRSQYFIKMKAEKVCELRVVGVVEGEGKYAGMLGALTCATECGKLKTNVGSGFSDADRKKYCPLGTIISVKYNEIIQDRSGGYSLFLPIYQSIRLDKTVANTLEELE